MVAGFLLMDMFHSPLLYRDRGAALLVEAADMGDADAQYELGCRLRVEVS